jgi:hypothetical protein
VRRITGRSGVALLAAVFTVFGGAYDLRPGRLWVNSLFMSGHEAYPLYPRDLVFGILPFAILAYLEALTGAGRRLLGWAIVAGGLIGLCALIQVQLLLPIPLVLLVISAAVGRMTGRVAPAIAVFLVCGTVATLLVAPWLLPTIDQIRHNGGIAIDSSDTLNPAQFGFWSYPRQFGLLLPLGLVGAGVALLLARRRDGPHPPGHDRGAWRPAGDAAVGGGLGLVAWFGLAFSLAVLYRPDWPLEDALRPQRLWLIASQPLAMLSAIGTVTIVEDLVARLRRPAWRPILAGGLCGAIVLVACAPATAWTVRIVASTWTTPTYAHLDLVADRVPAFDQLLPTTGPRAAVVTYEDWSSLAWYQTGCWVIAIRPAGFAKLAYDPARFTGHGQAVRRLDLARAFDGDPADLASVADSYHARTAVLARDPSGWIGLYDLAAGIAPDTGSDVVVGGHTAVDGNGWDGLRLDAGTRLNVAPRSTGPLHLQIRLVDDRPVAVRAADPDGPAASLRLVAVNGAGAERDLGTPQGPQTPGAWRVLGAAVDMAAD